MFLFLVSKVRYSVYAIGKNPDDCPLLEFLAELEANLHKDRDRMLALFIRVAEHGVPENMDISHQIQGKIYELIQGRLRVLWFYGEGRAVICTGGFIKKSRKTPRREIARAIEVMDQYFQAKREKQIVILEEEGG